MNVLVHKVLTEVGINPQRFNLQWASAAEAPRFVKLITEFTEQIKAFGPLGESEGIAPDDVRRRLAKAVDVVRDRKVRMFFGNATKAIRKEGVFTRERITEVIEDKMTKTLDTAFAVLEEPAAEVASAKKLAVKAKKDGVAPKTTAAKKAAPAKKKSAPKGKKT